LRDLALVAAAATYALGFIVWSIHAFRNNLGLLPTIDSQYIVAGLVSIIILGLPIGLIYIVIKRLPISERETDLAFLAILCFFGVVGVLALLIDILRRMTFPLEILGWITVPISFNEYVKTAAFWIEAVVTIADYIFLLIVSSLAVDFLRRKIGTFFYSLVLLALMAISIGYYAWIIYPNVSQALGGQNHAVPILTLIY
jgi:hypothetical protein